MNVRREPPGECAEVTSLVTVVLAPHYDDEVLGCGGLVAHLARGGTRVHVVFLTDGSGGVEEVGDRDAYAARRRAESVEAIRALGVSSSEHLALPDGSLLSSLDRLRSSLERVLLNERPDLLLLPSPLELTGDHRAAFAALHRVLTGLRAGDALFDVTAELRVLAYEVNHAAHPDLLVDVSRERAVIESAMSHYRSQLERHGYLDAALGLRRWRCLTLGPQVELAEGYRSLRAADFRTRTLAQLTTELGGVPALDLVHEGPLVSIVVRTKDRPALLAEALGSIAASTYRRLEVVLVNDGGARPLPPDGFALPLVRVDLDSNRGRAAAANAGVAAARGNHVLFLDDDDLIAPEHVGALVTLASASGARVAYTDAAVGIYEADREQGWKARSRSLPYSRDFDPDLLLFDNYIPFHTVLVERSLYQEVGPFDETLEFFEDWDLLIRLSRLTRFQHLPAVTCEYRHFRGAAHALGELGEARVDFVTTKARVLEKHRGLHTSDAVARAVVTLRREGVAAAQEVEAQRARLHELERAFHLRNGELESVREESERRRSALVDHERDFERLHAEEATLRRGIDQQLEHLGRTYAEIERLNAMVAAITADRDRAEQTIEAMKATRAWRLAERWRRLRGPWGRGVGGAS
ncbi:MAG TPA: PIG-L family deacetylase [Thermoanaerobaculia bacterium]|jgi:LmbE family N-acetylglucosaminyl deacetylase|nr:PIG-L family deacetylase [Thermoanaerobaculia bacterium]